MKYLLWLLSTISLIIIAIVLAWGAWFVYDLSKAGKICSIGCSGNVQSDVIIWRTGNDISTSDASELGYANPGIHQNTGHLQGHDSLNALPPLHVEATLIDMHFMKLPQGIPATSTIEIELVVYDHFGNYDRTISGPSIDFGAAADRIWHTIPLTGNVTIKAGEIVHGRLKFSPIPPNGEKDFAYALSGRATLN